MYSMMLSDGEDNEDLNIPNTSFNKKKGYLNKNINKIN